VPDLFWSSGDGKVLDWNSTVGIDAVIMKSQGANVYFYDPEALSDTGLISPETKDISHDVLLNTQIPDLNMTRKVHQL